MKTGIELIFEERKDQVNKHGFSIDVDIDINHEGQLTKAARILLNPKISEYRFKTLKSLCPKGWNLKLWVKMCEKSYYERVKISGSLCAAELDRLQSITS